MPSVMEAKTQEQCIKALGEYHYLVTETAEDAATQVLLLDRLQTWINDINKGRGWNITMEEVKTASEKYEQSMAKEWSK